MSVWKLKMAADWKIAASLMAAMKADGMSVTLHRVTETVRVNGVAYNWCDDTDLTLGEGLRRTLMDCCQEWLEGSTADASNVAKWYRERSGFAVATADDLRDIFLMQRIAA